MADWTHEPEIEPPPSGSSGPPPTLQTKLSDAKVISRIQHANAPEEWSEEYKVDGAEFDTMKAFYDARGIATSFTKLGYDLYGTPTTERTVRFSSAFDWDRIGQNGFIVKLTFTRHY